MKRSEGTLSRAAAQHLMAIAQLRSSRGYARVSDVARRLGITRGSASLTLKSLKQKGFVGEDENRFLVLTDKGLNEAEDGLGKKALWIRFLRDVLQCPSDQAELESSGLAHALSASAAERLTAFLEHFDSDDAEGFRSSLESR